MSKTALTANMTLLPGNHCGGYEVGTGFVLTLAPGEHYFLNGHLRITGAGMLQGDDVVAIFDNQSHLDADEDGVISLRGRRSGPFAGFVMVATRSNVSPFSISSTSARELLGTVYIPAATLRVSGTNTVADQSAWTVIVAKSLIVDGAANLVINSNYAGSTVPVPGGVGPNGGGARLTR